MTGTTSDTEIRETLAESESPHGGYVPMPLLNTAFELGHCQEAAESMPDSLARRMALAEYHYFSGNAEEAAAQAEPLLGHSDAALRLSACWVYGYANLATGNVRQARFALAMVQETLAGLSDAASPQVRALAGCVATGMSVLLHLPMPQNVPPIRESLRLLPQGLQFFALYVQAHHVYLQKDYTGSIGVVETALALGADRYPIPAIYLHLVATMDFMSLRQPEKAKEHLLAAWAMAQPDDLLEPLGEHHGLLGGMLEAVIKKDWPDDFKRIIAITYRFSAGWRKVHNPAAGRNVADNLTTTEFAAAMLAARDWTNQEIGAHMGISPNTVKRYISSALQKLGVSQRKDLKHFMLQ